MRSDSEPTDLYTTHGTAIALLCQLEGKRDGLPHLTIIYQFASPHLPHLICLTSPSSTNLQIDPRLVVATLHATIVAAMPTNMPITLGTRSFIPVALECAPGGSNNKVGLEITLQTIGR